MSRPVGQVVPFRPRTTRRPLRLADSPWPGVHRDGTVLVPVGSVEQHGPHLPLDTDTVIATAVAGRLAYRLGSVVAPAIAYGASGEHQAFAGTMSLGSRALAQTLIELTRSLTEWATAVVFVNGHGGNAPALNRAVEALTQEGRDASWVPCALRGADAHAGHTETSLMLHLDRRRVHVGRLAAGNLTPLSDLLPAIVADGVVAVTPTGVLGDPRAASAAHGRAVLAAMVDAAFARLGADSRTQS